jgi:hypothetical protein
MSEEIDPAKLAAEIVNGKHFVYGDDDVVICGWQGEGDPPVAGSTRQKCHICGAQVWVSPNSMNTVLDAVNAKQGAKLFMSLLSLLKPRRSCSLARSKKRRCGGMGSTSTS